MWLPPPAELEPQLPVTKGRWPNPQNRGAPQQQGSAGSRDWRCSLRPGVEPQPVVGFTFPRGQGSAQGQAGPCHHLPTLCSPAAH